MNSFFGFGLGARLSGERDFRQIQSAQVANRLWVPVLKALVAHD